MLAIYHVSRNTPWFSEDLKLWTRESVIKSPNSWIMRIKMLVVYILREREQFFLSCVLGGEKQQKENKRSGKRTKEVERTCAF